jgi:hypothetical protein
MTKMECFIKKSRKGYDSIVDDMRSCGKPIVEIIAATLLIIGMVLPTIIVGVIVITTNIIPSIAVISIFLSGIVTFVWGRCIYFPLIECVFFKGDDV